MRAKTRAALVSYDGPPMPGELAASLGLPLEAICKLDANESPYGPPPAALDALASVGRALLGPGRYPDPSASALRAALAERLGVMPEQLAVGNGSDELIHLLADLALRPGDEVVVHEPTFSLYALAGRQRGATVVDSGCTPNFTVTPQRITQAMTEYTRLVFLCSPNNPTGTALLRETLRAALDRAAELSAERDGISGPLVIVDEAYYELGELSGSPEAWTAVPLLRKHPQLVVLRTFSKLYGLAGLRVGFMASSSELAERVRALKLPYNVNVAGQVAARAALTETAWLGKQAVELVRERERVADMLSGLPCGVMPSAANFLLVEVASSWQVWSSLLAQGIMVRAFTDERLTRYLRITIGTPEQNDRLLAAMSDILGNATDIGGNDERR